MAFTMCGAIVGSRILVVTQHVCHAVGSCSECLMRTCSMHAIACVHVCVCVCVCVCVVNVLSQHINKVERPPCCKSSKNAVTLERSLLREIRELKIFYV